jgi:hypothetical protein
MEPAIACICMFTITGGMVGVAFYEHCKILEFIKVIEKKQLIGEKTRKDLTKGKYGLLEK